MPTIFQTICLLLLVVCTVVRAVWELLNHNQWDHTYGTKPVVLIILACSALLVVAAESWVAVCILLKL